MDGQIGSNEGDVILDLYEVKGSLGEGGMGKVYRVHHAGWKIDLTEKSPKREALRRAGGVGTSSARPKPGWTSAYIPTSSPDGTLVLSAGVDGRLRRWEAGRWMRLT